MPSRNRGKPKLKLRDLGRVPPSTQEIDAISNALSEESAHPITAAILGAVKIEHQLELMLQARLPRKDGDTWDTLITENGPLRSFSTKIIMGYAFRMYDEKTRDALHVVRRIRNTFAHSNKIIGFDHPLITTELQKAATLQRGIKQFLKNPLSVNARRAYVSLCFQLSASLYRTESRRYRAASNWYNRKTAKLWAAQNNPYAALFSYTPEALREWAKKQKPIP
jgi:hypothetical protein